MRKQNLDPEVAHAINVERRTDMSFAELRTEEVVERKSDVFRRNIRFLIKQRGMKKAGIAKALGLSEEWLRQVSRRGLSQVRKGSRTSLDRLRGIFWLDSVGELWSVSLIDRLKQTERRAAQMHPFLRSKDWNYAVKFMELLQSGEYDFLRHLMDKLYGHEIATADQSVRGGKEEADVTSKRRQPKTFHSLAARKNSAEGITPDRTSTTSSVVEATI